jgi:hypothetical protein
VTHKIASGVHRCEHNTRGYAPKLDMWPLTCTHVLDVPSHADDQAAIRKTIDQLSTPALIFRCWYPRSDLSLSDFFLYTRASAMLGLSARKKRKKKKKMKSARGGLWCDGVVCVCWH